MPNAELKPAPPARQRLVALGLLCLGAASAGAQLANPGFETHSGGRPSSWNGGGWGYEVVIDSVSPLAGRFSLRTRWLGGEWSASPKFAAASQQYPVTRAAGRRLRLTGYVRTQDVANGYAGLWMRVDGPMGMIAIDNMQNRGVQGTTPWMKYEVELPVDSGAVMVILGAIHPGDGTAWFDSLTVEVVGPAMPRTVAASKFEPRAPDDMSRLLTDAELALPADTVAVPEDSAYAAWVRANAHPIRSLGATDFKDLRFLAPLLTNRRIVQLGESGHGVAEFSMAKVRLIKYLHEELGYDVMAFESSVYECNRAQRDVAIASATDLMRSCIFGVWQVREVVPLFEYIKQTQNTAHPLILAGFDEQMSSQSLARGRPGFFRALIAPIDTAYARYVYDVDSTFVANANREYALQHRERFVPFYDSLATFFRVNRQAIEAARRDDPDAALVARQAATSMVSFVSQLAIGPTLAGTEIRDRAMADNFDFLLDELYPKKKVIVWAHNFHIQKRDNTVRGTSDTTSAPRTMGTYVATRHRAEAYTIGLFMYRGGASQNDRRPYAVRRMATGSLESILHRAPWQFSFVDFSRQRQTRGNEWMWKPLTAMAWGINPERMIPRDEYDAIIFIDTTHVPVYLTY